MLQSVTFKNFRALRNCTLELGPVTILIGPNGVGKSSVLQGIEFLAGIKEFKVPGDRSIQVQRTLEPTEVYGQWRSGDFIVRIGKRCTPHETGSCGIGQIEERIAGRGDSNIVRKQLSELRRFEFNEGQINRPCRLTPNPKLSVDGYGLAAVLDNLRDSAPEVFELLNRELENWLPEFDRVLFHVPSDGDRSFCLRQRSTQHILPASSLSTGTLFSVALLAISFDPSPPPIILLEEPDRALHPRMLYHVREAINRLAYPQAFGSKRDPVQVIATTHSPYFLDLFKDHPEEVVIADKTEDGVKFKRLSDRPRIEELLPDGALGELWYSGLLGGVPVQP